MPWPRSPRAAERTPAAASLERTAAAIKPASVRNCVRASSSARENRLHGMPLQQRAVRWRLGEIAPLPPAVQQGHGLLVQRLQFAPAGVQLRLDLFEPDARAALGRLGDGRGFPMGVAACSCSAASRSLSKRVIAPRRALVLPPRAAPARRRNGRCVARGRRRIPSRWPPCRLACRAWPLPALLVRLLGRLLAAPRNRPRPPSPPAPAGSPANTGR